MQKQHDTPAMADTKNQESMPKFEKKEVEGIAKKVFFVLAIITIIAVPLIVSKQFFFPFIVPRSAAFMILVDLMVVNWAVLYWANPGKYRIDIKNPIVLGVLGLLGVWTVSGIFGADWTLSFWSTYQRMTGILLLMHLTAFLLTVSTVLRDRKIWNKLLFIFSLTGVAVALYTIAGPHGFGIANSLDISRGGATIGNTSFLGTYLLFTIFTTLMLIANHYQKHKRVKIQHAVMLAIGLINPAIINFKLFAGEAPIGDLFSNPLLILGEARAVAASIWLGLILAGALYLLRQKEAWKKIAGSVVSIGIFLTTAVGMVLVFQPGTAVYNAFGQMTNWARYLIWGESIDAFRERPLLGWGPESFDLLHQRFIDARLFVERFGGELWFDRAHNIVLDTLVSTGVLGLLAYIGVFVSLFWVVYRLRIAGKISNGIAALVGGLVFAYLLQGMTVFDMTVSYFAFFLVLTYFAAQMERSEVVFKIKESAQQIIPSVVALVAIVVLFAFPVRVLNSSWAISASLTAASLEERLELYEAGHSLTAGRTLFMRTVSTRMYDILRQNPQYINPTSAPAIRTEAAFFEERLLQEAETRPYNFRAYIGAAKMAQLRAFVGETEKVNDALAYTEEAALIAPQNPISYMTMAELYLMQGDYDAAEDAMAKALAKAPESTFLQRSHALTLDTLNKLRAGETPNNPEEPITLQ